MRTARLIAHQCKLRDHAIPALAWPMLFEPPGLLCLHPTIFFAPTVVGLVTDLQASTYFFDGLSLAGYDFRFTQFGDNILGTKPFVAMLPAYLPFCDIFFLAFLPLIFWISFWRAGQPGKSS